MADRPWWEQEEWKKKFKKLEEESERLRKKKLREERGVSRKRQKQPREQVKSVPNKPVDLTDATFKEVIQKHPLVVVDCWAPWCAPCHMVAPIIEEIARDYVGKILFGKLNIDRNRNVAMQYQIMSIPTLLVFKNGKLVDQILGAMPRKMLEPKIIQHL